MSFRVRASAVAIVGLLILATPGARAEDEMVKPFVGNYVGSGTAENMAAKNREVRDLDVSITPFKDDGFTIKWITVIRDEAGARTDPDVKRRLVSGHLMPVEDKENLFVLAPDGGLFQKSETPDLLKGDAVRWASIDGSSMIVYSLAIGAAGGSELQVYRRTLTEKGMDVVFVRLKDEAVVVRMTGQLVRTN
jgi:hypothetical protein